MPSSFTSLPSITLPPNSLHAFPPPSSLKENISPLLTVVKFCFISDKKHNFRKYNVSKIDSLGIPYDYLSVMHYSSNAFGINGLTTIIAKDPSVEQLGQRIGLSPLDVRQADLLYDCKGR